MSIIDKGKEVCVVLNENDFIKIMSSKESTNSIIIKNKNGILAVSQVEEVKKKNEKDKK